jgi:hypothetical protein
MTVRISRVLWLGMAVGAGGCNPKQAPTRVAPEAASDTAPPPVPTSFAPPRDSTRTVAVPDDPSVRYHRHIIGVVFDDSTSGATVKAVFRKYQAVVVGGMPDWGNRGAYIVEVPDTVTTYQGLQSFIEKVGSEIGVDFAFGETWRGKVVPRGDYSATRPPIPDSPSEPDDSAFTAVSPADPRFVYYRRLYDVVFLDNATDAQVLAFFAKYQASIVGGAPLVDIYTVQVPDPGVRRRRARDRSLNWASVPSRSLS